MPLLCASCCHNTEITETNHMNHTVDQTDTDRCARWEGGVRHVTQPVSPLHLKVTNCNVVMKTMWRRALCSETGTQLKCLSHSWRRIWRTLGGGHRGGQGERCTVTGARFRFLIHNQRSVGLTASFQHAMPPQQQMTHGSRMWWSRKHRSLLQCSLHVDNY